MTRTEAMAELMLDLCSSKETFMLVLNEREQDMRHIPMDSTGAPAQDADSIASVEVVVTEGLARLHVNDIREYKEGTRVFECRCPARDPETGKPITMLHYVHAASVLRVGMRSRVSIDLGG